MMTREEYDDWYYSHYEDEIKLEEEDEEDEE